MATTTFDKPVGTEIKTLSDQIATNVITTGTLDSIKTALVTLAGTLSINQIVKVRFGITPAAGKFTASSYYGTLIKYGSTAIMVSLTNLAGYHYEGFYNDGTWTWTSTNPALSLAAISNDLNNAKSDSIVMYTNAEAANVTNAPYSDLGGYVIVHRLSDNEVIQTYYQRNVTGPIRVKTRVCVSGAWTTWREHEAVLALTSTQKLLTVANDDTLCPVNSTTIINLYGCDSSDLPSSSYKYGFATVEKYASKRIIVTVKSCVLGTTIAVNRMQTDNSWGGWKLTPRFAKITKTISSGFFKISTSDLPDMDPNNLIVCPDYTGTHTTYIYTVDRSSATEAVVYVRDTALTTSPYQPPNNTSVTVRVMY